MVKLEKGQNKVYVWSGVGYELQTIYINQETISIEELAYICIKSGKGWFIAEQDTDEEIEECQDVFCYVDLSSYGLENGYLCIENLRTENVEIYS